MYGLILGQLSKSSPFTAAEKPPSSSKLVQENVAKLASGPVALSSNEVEASNDLNAAKVAAMKAAELGTLSFFLGTIIAVYTCVNICVFIFFFFFLIGYILAFIGAFQWN